MIKIFYSALGGEKYSASITEFALGNDICTSNRELVSVETRFSGLIKLYQYCSTHTPTKNISVIYIEGHGGSAVDIGLDHMEFLAEQGFRVFYMDMPLTGSNSNNLNISHHDLGTHEQNGILISPIVSEFTYPVSVFINYINKHLENQSVALFGRSGGGWLSYVAGALYDVDYVVSVAGGTPHSMRLSAQSSIYEIGDWEQWSPKLYSMIGHEDFMRFSAKKRAAYIYNANDPCCFRLNTTDPFYTWLRDINPQVIQVYIDQTNNDHSLGAEGKFFLNNLFLEW